MPISYYIEKAEKNSSWIRKMFEIGQELKEKHGENKIADFSIGNPQLKPPKAFLEAIKAHLEDEGVHRYMPGAGFPDVRTKIAVWLEKKFGIPFTAKHIVMTTGAAGAMNTILKTILNEGEEVLVPEPFFPEYTFYAENHQGKLVAAESKENFDLDLKKIAEKINSKTRAVIINSPNNPTGKIYSEKQLRDLAGLLEEKQKEFNSQIYVLSDEPYREITFGREVKSIVSFYPNSFMIYSWSKSLNIPGERIGYIAVNPKIDDPRIIEKLAFCNRILGFVNAPAILQKAVADVLDERVDIEIYRKKRDRISQGLRKAGIEFTEPEGAFYFFPKSPMENDLEFVQKAAEKLVLVTPGSGFGRKGNFRMSYAVKDETIELGLKKLAELMGELT